jgi:hypothetical protein
VQLHGMLIYMPEVIGHIGKTSVTEFHFFTL